MLLDDVIANICKVYAGTDATEIKGDFKEFLTPLVDEGIVILGRDEKELSLKDPSFSYDVENPKTMDTHAPQPKADGEIVTQDVMDRYFADHPTIFSLQMDITQACTERCIHCYIPEYNPVFLPFEQIKTVINQFRDQGGLTLALSGGECMMHPDFDKIVRYAREKDLIVGILSNLTLCDERKIELLQESEATVQVSLYSMNPKTHDAITQRPGSFEKTKTVIERIRAAHIPCRISCPTMKPNYKDYLDVLAYARSLKMDAQTDYIIMGKMDCDTSNLSCRLNLDETRHILEDIVCKSLPVNNKYFDPAKKEQLESDDEFAQAGFPGYGGGPVYKPVGPEYYQRQTDQKKYNKFECHISSSAQTFSTCWVWGNMSTGWTAVILYFVQSISRSLAWDAGLQLTYTMRLGDAFRITLTTSGCIPALGGSTMMTSGFPCSSMNASLRTSFMSPAKNSQLSMPLPSALVFAS